MAAPLIKNCKKIVNHPSCGETIGASPHFCGVGGGLCPLRKEESAVQGAQIATASVRTGFAMTQCEEGGGVSAPRPTGVWQ